MTEKNGNEESERNCIDSFGTDAVSYPDNGQGK